jgi:Protein of unknown function (DUF1302)
MSMRSIGRVQPHAGSSAARLAVPAAAAALFLSIGVAPRAGALDFQDGRLQIHGYFEEQIRALGKNLSPSDNIDLAQWYHVLSTEIEYDFAPNGWGPFDVLSGYARIEARYDCVWHHACGIFPSANAFGDNAQKLPGYKTNGERTGLSGSLSIADQINHVGLKENIARFTAVKYRPVPDERLRSALFPNGGTPNAFLTPAPERKPMHLDQLDGFVGLFAVKGTNGIFEANGHYSQPYSIDGDGNPDLIANDDPAYFYFSKQLGCLFGSRKVPAGANGRGNQIIGPIDPSCKIDPSAGLIAKPNPFNPADPNPIVFGGGGLFPGQIFSGSGELPGRPASEFPLGQRAPNNASQGVYYPSPAYRNFLRNGRADKFDQNFTETELSFNHGGSQQDEKEFKEGYLDMEFFDSRLWVRAGKQNIVWGKTELFRTTDQFNPQDLALASLPSLEESRIALWSVRGVWSFYDVGPLEDVRLELAANLDDFEPADIGRCGEPFTALVACNKTTGLWAHGLFGVALAGEHRPPNFWEDPSGLEYGGRLEFRYGRFSFQISDFYGYDDFPFVKRISSFENRKDPNSGRPLRRGATGSCTTGFEAACLPIQSNFSISPTDPNAADPARDTGAFPANPALGTLAARQDTLVNMSANMQIFSAICATSIGFNQNDTRACGQSVFNSKAPLIALGQGIDAPVTQRKTGAFSVTIASLLSNTLAGNQTARGLVRAQFTGNVPIPYVTLNVDPCDAFLSNGNGTCSTIPGRAPVSAFALGNAHSLNQTLTDEQESLLGCGPFWGTDCESDGIDLLNAEASVLMQSFPGIEGDYGKFVAQNGLRGYCIGCVDPTTGQTMPVPGTLGFRGGLPGARPVADGHALAMLPGSRGPGDPGYNINVDGSTTGLAIPPVSAGQPHDFRGAAGLPFRSEMAALSWNFLMTLVAFSSVPSPISVNRGHADQNQFDPDNPDSLASGQCSLLQPQFCSSVISFFSITGAQRNSVRAGGTGEFGRRDFVWQGGGEGVLEYQKRNVLGFSADFAEDVTKSNWGMEATWIDNVRFTDNNSFQGVNTGDTFNLTVSVDRPTFINFLNPNRTFFFNSQVFFQYINNFRGGFTANGPFNMLGTFTIQTGYFQDRLLPNVTFVYDINSNSGAALPSITYRFTESFSATVGVNFFWGRWEFEHAPIAPLGTLGNEAGKLAYRDAVENGLSVVRERDEVFLRIRYTF